MSSSYGMGSWDYPEDWGRYCQFCNRETCRCDSGSPTPSNYKEKHVELDVELVRLKESIYGKNAFLCLRVWYNGKLISNCASRSHLTRVQKEVSWSLDLPNSYLTKISHGKNHLIYRNKFTFFYDQVDTFDKASAEKIEEEKKYVQSIIDKCENPESIILARQEFKDNDEK